MVSRRVVTSYKARYGLNPANKAGINNVANAIDVHAHARGVDEEDPLAAAQEATKAGMSALVYKSISPGAPWEVAKQLQEDVNRWAEQERLRPVRCLSAYIVGIPIAPVDFGKIKAAIAGGISAIWMPPVTSAWSIHRLGGRGAWYRDGRADEPFGPIPFEDALEIGMYLLDEHGKLIPEIRDTIRMCHDHGVAMSFGHASPQEMDAMAEEVAAVGYKRAFIDHPFSEVFQLDVAELKRWAAAGVRFVLTFDEISPLLGVDPQDMVAAVRAVGPEHFTLASDAGIPLLPDTVDAYRLLARLLRAYGVTEPEMQTMMVDSPSELLGRK
ncbi:MAG TPA: DUF6282 family protein [Chloroflexota bacterium]|nr:DUF6282 family protein [Chloroflexota bacterium]